MTNLNKSENKMETCYSLDDEDFCYSCPEDVFDALDREGRLKVGTPYYEAAARPLTTQRLLRADVLLDDADSTGYDLVGDSWFNPFNVSKEAEAELQKLLNTWAAKYVDVSHYFEIIGRPKLLRVTEADLIANPSVDPDGVQVPRS